MRSLPLPGCNLAAWSWLGSRGLLAGHEISVTCPEAGALPGKTDSLPGSLRVACDRLVSKRSPELEVDRSASKSSPNEVFLFARAVFVRRRSFRRNTPASGWHSNEVPRAYSAERPGKDCLAMAADDAWLDVREDARGIAV